MPENTYKESLKKEYECEQSRILSINKNNLNIHIRSHDPSINDTECHPGGKIFPIKKHLTDHMEKYDGKYKSNVKDVGNI